MSGDAPGWLVHALGHTWLCCAGCGPVDVSLKFGPDDDDRWDWGPVIHHGRPDCPVLGDDAAMADLGYSLLAELSCHVFMACYGERLPDHTAMGAPT